MVTPKLTEDQVAGLAMLATGKSVEDFLKPHSSFIKELQATQAERSCIGVVDGVYTETVPHYTCRNRETARLLIGPDKLYFGMEWTWIPWNIFKKITVRYWLWVDQVSKEKAKEILTQAGVTNGWAEEDPYADPTRWHLWVKTLEDAVKIWKVTPKVQLRKLLTEQKEFETNGGTW